MTQVRISLFGAHFRANHAVRAVGGLLQFLSFNRLGKGRPATAGIKLIEGAEQRLAAHDIDIDALLKEVIILTGEGALGRGVLRDLIGEITDFFAERLLALLFRKVKHLLRNVAVAVRIFIEILLVVFLCRIEVLDGC